MKSLRWAPAVLALTAITAAAALLAGCKGFWDPLPSSGGGTASGVFYVLNFGKGQVAGFAFASGSTSPAAVTGSPVTPQAAPLAMAISPNGNFLYVSTSGGIFAYSIASTGALTLLNNTQAIDADLLTTMAVDSSGTWLVGAISGGSLAYAIPISSSTGLVDSTRTEQTANLPATTVQQVAMSPSGATNSYVFFAMGTAGTTVIPFTSGNAAPIGGTSTSYKVKNASGSDATLAVDPTNPLLYVGETVALTGTQTGGLRVYNIGANSSLTEVSGSPYATGGTGPSAILANGKFVYVANRAVKNSSNGIGNITGYPVVSSGGTYSLGTLVNTIAAGITTAGLAEDNTSTYILAVNSGGSPDLSTYTFDTTGKLTAGATAATGSDPVQATAVAAVP
ncbi:MAG TPA: beta-propeller fold lactonase family protein [Terracidiphilus sp.]|jgi:6-phosphogluconolactonase (cycloisomerase 2 family)|nr:beta-propeller fold lactonase family protein [Terracidiphilus sp.]